MRHIADEMHVHAERIHVREALFQIPSLSGKRILHDIGDFQNRRIPIDRLQPQSQ
jgi:hypothetical protein